MIIFFNVPVETMLSYYISYELKFSISGVIHNHMGGCLKSFQRKLGTTRQSYGDKGPATYCSGQIKGDHEPLSNRI